MRQCPIDVSVLMYCWQKDSFCGEKWCWDTTNTSLLSLSMWSISFCTWMWIIKWIRHLHDKCTSVYMTRHPCRIHNWWPICSFWTWIYEPPKSSEDIGLLKKRETSLLPCFPKSLFQGLHVWIRCVWWHPKLNVVSDLSCMPFTTRFIRPQSS